jgi:hypothetical protein
LLRFHFWKPVYYFKSETSFPSQSKEGLGNIVGISEHCGNALTYKILTADTGHIIYRSLLRSATTDDANLCASKFAGEPDTHNEIGKSRGPTPHTMKNPNLLTLSHHHQYSIHKILLENSF